MLLGTSMIRTRTATPPDMSPEEQDAREALWRARLRVVAAADGRAAHQPKLAPSRRGFWRAFLGEPQPTPDTLPPFLTDPD